MGYGRKSLQAEEQYLDYKKKLGQRGIYKWNKIKLKGKIPQTPTET